MRAAVGMLVVAVCLPTLSGCASSRQRSTIATERPLWFATLLDELHKPGSRAERERFKENWRHFLAWEVPSRAHAERSHDVE